MNHQINMVMTETSPEIAQLCKEAFADKQINLTVCERDGAAAYKAIEENKPNFVLLDVFMPQMDAITLKKKYNQQYPNEQIVFYATGSFQSDSVERDIMMNGFSFYFLKPFDVTVLANKIEEQAGLFTPKQHQNAPANFEMSVEEKVTNMLHEIGVPAHIKGYNFLRQAIVLVVEKPTLINAVTKSLYPQIAEMNETTPPRVERAIRHAIEVAWNRGDIDTLTSYFGSTIKSMRGKPTNSEFIAMLSDKIHIELERKNLA